MRYAIYLFVFLLVSSCSSESKEPSDVDLTETQVQDSTPPTLEEEMDSSQTVTIPKVLIIPCANGYEYNVRDGDVNPSLEEYLTLDERVTVEPFPYKKMQGAGYYGVYDKKHCASILENTDADFLIMTRMKGGLMPMQLMKDSTTSPNWGYSTRILNTSTMEQIDGIRGSQFPTFESLDPDVKKKIDALIRLILDSHTES
ncbi:MAG: hypothetical protein AB8B56_05000 [Crocinitomicaceae bacterium]